MSELHAPLIHADVIPQKRIESLQFDARINGMRFATFKRVNESLHIYSVKKKTRNYCIDPAFVFFDIEILEFCFNSINFNFNLIINI